MRSLAVLCLAAAIAAPDALDLVIRVSMRRAAGTFRQFSLVQVAGDAET
jgi:hypothetical protein